MSSHVLVVGPFDPDDDIDRFDVEHPVDCPVEHLGPPEHPYCIHTCGVGYHIEATGIAEWFIHADDPAPAGRYQIRVPTGRHGVETWSEMRPAGPWGPAEWDGGIELADARALSGEATPCPD